MKEFFNRLLDFYHRGVWADPSENQETSILIDKKEFELSYPPAAQSRKMITQGKYPLGYPEGAVIHYNAGRFNTKDFLTFMRKRKYVTFLIDRDGHVWQDFSLDEWGYHAGKSTWGDIQGTVNNRFIGIEVMSAGRVKWDALRGRYKSWFGTYISKEDVRWDIGADEHYHAFTLEQEKQLMKLILWLHSNGQGIFSLDNVVGHHEVSPGRKHDPGAALSYNMEDYREHLKRFSSKQNR